MKKFVLSLIGTLTIATSHAATVQLDLLGKGGAGLLGSNEWTNGAPIVLVGTPGSGGETGAGMLYDNVTKVLTLNFSWTGLQGTEGNPLGMATGFHIHGPVTAADAMGNTAGVLHNISGNIAGGGAVPNYTIVNNVNGTGSITGSISSIPLAQEADLLDGKWYVNVHSGRNGGGEIRGNLVVVPEPGSVSIATLGLLALGAQRRR